MRNLIILSIAAFTIAVGGIKLALHATAKTPPPMAATAEPADPLGPARVVLVAGRGGHFHVGALIDKTYVDFVVDTGASRVALTYKDAQRLGIRLEPRDFRSPVSTANGVVRAADVIIPSIKIRNIRVNNVSAMVLPAGALGTNLLGNSFLSRLKSYEVRSGQLSLEQ